MEEFQAFLERGGALMFPILAFSVIALTVFIARLWTLRRGSVMPRDFLELIQDKLKEQKAEEALTLCEGNRSTLSRVLASGLRYAGRPREQIKEAFEEVGRLEIAQLERFVELLGTIASVTPLLGLLGTVVGMIEVFRAVVSEAASSGAVEPASLANGIWAALLTTAAGLSVAIPCFLAYKFLYSRVDRLSMEMEEATLRVLDLLAGDSE